MLPTLVQADDETSFEGPAVGYDTCSAAAIAAGLDAQTAKKTSGLNTKRAGFGSEAHKNWVAADKLRLPRSQTILFTGYPYLHP